MTTTNQMTLSPRLRSDNEDLIEVASALLSRMRGWHDRKNPDEAFILIEDLARELGLEGMEDDLCEELAEQGYRVRELSSNEGPAYLFEAKYFYSSQRGAASIQEVIGEESFEVKLVETRFLWEALTGSDCMPEETWTYWRDATINAVSNRRILNAVRQRGMWDFSRFE